MQRTTARVLLSAIKHLPLNSIHHFNRSQATLAKKQDFPHLLKFWPRPKISSCASPVIHQKVKIFVFTSSVGSSLCIHMKFNSVQISETPTHRSTNTTIHRPCNSGQLTQQTNMTWGRQPTSRDIFSCTTSDLFVQYLYSQQEQSPYSIALLNM